MASYIPKDIEDMFNNAHASMMIAPLIGHIRRITDEKLTRTSVMGYYRDLSLIYMLLQDYFPEQRGKYRKKQEKCIRKVEKYRTL
ncbi:MAG: hypothetical protein ACP5D2_01935 [Candidatus Nanoarchaeia archaeon]